MEQPPSISSPPEPAGPTLWCLGLKRTGSRRLGELELARVAALARTALASLWKPALPVLLSPFLLLLGAVFLDVQGRRGGTAGAVLGTCFLAAGVVLLGAGLLRSLTVLRRWRLLRQDLARGEVECFGEASAATEETPGARSLEVLPRSQALLSANGKPILRWLAVPVAEATAPPAAPLRLAVSKTLADRLDSSVVVERRRLSAAELEELARHIVRLKAPSGTLVLLIALTVLGLALSLAAGETFRGLLPRDLAYAGLVSVALGLNIWVYLRARRLARRLARDRQDEWVWILAKEAAAGSAAGAVTVAEGPTVEMLPASGVVWTENGQPGGWRLSEGRRNRR